jgi:formylglycine-generating enzyme
MGAMTEPAAPCCSPSRDAGPRSAALAGPTVTARVAGAEGMVRLGGGEFLMGDDSPDGFPADGEGPVRSVRLSPFWIDEAAVSNGEFAAFVDATGYMTETERFGASFVFWGLLPEGFPATRAVAGMEWWRHVEGADWRHPEGPGSSVGERSDHPVVHVTWADAAAYAAWAGKRLPTEAEWEYAARGGLERARYPWGDELTPEGVHRCNVWQGDFPRVDTAEDGFAGTAPVRWFEPNGHGLHNVAGNVWEWCADWFSPDWHRSSPRVDPAGPPGGTLRVQRGGSYLCHASYCNRYRVAARMAQTPDSSSGNVGFRCALDGDAAA